MTTDHAHHRPVRSRIPSERHGCHWDWTIITVKVCTHLTINDHGGTPPTAPLAQPATEAYPLHSINVPALDLGFPDEPLFIDSFAEVAPEPSGLRNLTEEDLIVRAAASIEVRGPDRKAEASIDE